MRFVIQRVMHSKVTINGEVRGQIGKGFMVLIGVGEEDTVEIADKMIHKMVNMRIFEDENGKTNLGLKEVGGSLLLISQFTLSSAVPAPLQAAVKINLEVCSAANATLPPPMTKIMQSMRRALRLSKCFFIITMFLFV